MKSATIFVSLTLLTFLLASAASEVFVEEIGETETISIDEPTRDDKFVDVDGGVSQPKQKQTASEAATSRSKRATDYSAEADGEAYEDEDEDSAAAGSGSEQNYEDEVCCSASIIDQSIV